MNRNGNAGKWAMMIKKEMVNRYLKSAIWFFALVFLTVPVFCFGQESTPGTTQVQKGTGASEPSTPSKVTVEVKKSEGKDAPEVKVQVEGKTEQTPAPAAASEPSKILPLPGEKLSPVEAEHIEKAAQTVGKKVNEIEFKLGLKWGAWVWTEAFFGITWFKILVLMLGLALVFLMERVIRWLIDKRLRRVVDERREPSWNEVILDAASKPLSLFIIVYGLYATISQLFDHLDRFGLGNAVRSVTGGLTDLLGTVTVLWLFYRLLYSLEAPLRRQVYSEKGVDTLLVTLVGKSLRLFVVVLGMIFLIQNLTGLQLGPLLASLGLGGLAVALAAKDSISNFFGTLTIIFDNSYQVGEHIKLDKYEGVVESIGFRSTRIRTPDGALVSIPNEKAVNSGVENVGRRTTIRWHTNVGLRYDTPSEKVFRAVEIISEILNDPNHMGSETPPRVFFDDFKESSLNITIFVWYQPVVWWQFMAWRQDRCLKIIQEFEREGIEFAYPVGAIALGQQQTETVTTRS